MIYMVKPAFDFIRAKNFENIEKRKYHLIFLKIS